MFTITIQGLPGFENVVCGLTNQDDMEILLAHRLSEAYNSDCAVLYIDCLDRESDGWNYRIRIGSSYYHALIQREEAL